MIRFDEFIYEPMEFWHRARFISEALGYTTCERVCRDRRVMSYSADSIIELFRSRGYAIDGNEAEKQAYYSRLRAIAADEARDNLMTAQEAREAYLNTASVAFGAGFSWRDLGINAPMNKQTGEKKDVSFLTALVDLLTYYAIRDTEYVADYDPHALIKVSDRFGRLQGVSSRRFDGAINTVENPLIVWEIKEYYYTTTFGSRISDGVYETRLDGFELNSFEQLVGYRPLHVLFTDSYSVWWEQGKSYLCRLIDMLNEGSVDRIYFGREVFDWETDLKNMLEIV